MGINVTTLSPSLSEMRFLKCFPRVLAAAEFQDEEFESVNRRNSDTEKQETGEAGACKRNIPVETETEHIQEQGEDDVMEWLQIYLKLMQLQLLLLWF